MFKSEIICLTSLGFFRNLVLAPPPSLQTDAVRGNTPDLKVVDESGDMVSLSNYSVKLNSFKSL